MEGGNIEVAVDLLPSVKADVFKNDVVYRPAGRIAVPEVLHIMLIIYSVPNIDCNICT